MRKSLLFLLILGCGQKPLDCTIDDQGRMPTACIKDALVPVTDPGEPTVTYGLKGGDEPSYTLDCRVTLLGTDECRFRLPAPWACIKIEDEWECFK